MAKAKTGVVIQPIRRTYRAEVALTRGQCVVQGTAEDQVKLPAAMNDKIIGYVEEDAAAGAPVSIVVGGETIAIVGGAVAAGNYVKCAGATGKVVQGVVAGENIAGRAVSGNAADGDEIVVLVMFATA